MQIIVKSEGYTYMYDTTGNDKFSEDGLEPDFLTAEEAIATALRLLPVLMVMKPSKKPFQK